MLTKSPVLHGFPTLLSGSTKRGAQDVISAGAARLRESAPGPLARLLAEEIPPELLERHREDIRRSTYCDVTTFWTFLSQTFSEDASCARAVAGVQEWRRALGKTVPGALIGAYVDARKRLPLGMLQAVHQHVCASLDRELGDGNLWRGLRPKAIDGTSALMPDTVENQAAYPQPDSQAEGCGFLSITLYKIPRKRLVSVFQRVSLFTS